MIVVTGCAGFIGSQLTERLLKDGHAVIGIDCFTDYYSKKQKEANVKQLEGFEGFSLRRTDLLQLKPDAFKGVDSIYHLAAQPGVRSSWGDSFGQYINNNIMATQRLLEICRKVKVKRIVMASSSSVYGDVDTFPIKEDSKLSPLSPYGMTKLAAENLCRLYWKSYSIPSVILRYFTVYGPRQRPDMAFHKFIKSALKNSRMEIYGDGGQERDFTFVSDIVAGTILAMEAGEVDGEVFNIGGGRSTRLAQAVQMIRKLTGSKEEPAFLEKQKGESEKTLADIKKARDCFGYRPKVGLEEGIGLEVEWMRQNISAL
ncbi:GDP-mannose 4,6-dehydratase [archaeon]|nr:GDP-mannose 4,6-dehydratase [archaeon]